MSRSSRVMCSCSMNSTRFGITIGGEHGVHHRGHDHHGPPAHRSWRCAASRLGSAGPIFMPDGSMLTAPSRNRSTAAVSLTHRMPPCPRHPVGRLTRVHTPCRRSGIDGANAFRARQLVLGFQRGMVSHPLEIVSCGLAARIFGPNPDD